MSEIEFSETTGLQYNAKKDAKQVAMAMDYLAAGRDIDSVLTACGATSKAAVRRIVSAASNRGYITTAKRKALLGDK